jgi:dsRNA-specific ribonuclease
MISDNLSKLLENLKHKSFSLINIYPLDVYSFEKIRKTFKGKLVNSVVVQSKSKFTLVDKSFKLVTPKIFNQKRIEFYEKTKNGVVIWNGDFESLEGLQAYYPIIYINGIDDEEKFKTKFKSQLGDWKHLYYKNDNLIVLINRAIKEFKTFTFEDFEITPPIKVAEEEKVFEELGLVEKKNKASPKPVTRQKPEDYINFDIFKELPSPTIYPPDRKNIKWCQEFYTYLLSLLKIIVPVEKKKLIDYILNKETFKNVWLKAFTHFSTHPDVSQNYEALEQVGDKILKTSFFNYYFQRYPYATANELNDSSTETQSDEEQSKISHHMGLIKWIWVDEVLRDNANIKEDLLEAFAGAVNVSLIHSGISGGSIVIFANLFDLLYSNKDIRSEINAQTWLHQLIKQIAPRDIKPKEEEDNLISFPRPPKLDMEIYNQLLKRANNLLEEEGIDKKITSQKIKKDKDNEGIDFEEIITEDKRYKFNIRINEYGASVFKYYGFNFKKNQIIGSVIEPTKRPAKRHAANRAREFLASKGIDQNWVNNQKFKKKMGDLGDLADRVILKAKQKHKDIISINIEDKKLKKDHIFVLVGTNKKGYKYFLDRYVSDGEPGNNYLILAKKFLGID